MPESAEPVDPPPVPAFGAPDRKWLNATRTKVMKGLVDRSTVSLPLPDGFSDAESLGCAELGDVYRVQWVVGSCADTDRMTLLQVLNEVNRQSVGMAQVCTDDQGLFARFDLVSGGTDSDARTRDKAVCAAGLADLFEIARRLRIAIVGPASGDAPTVAPERARRGRAPDWTTLAGEVAGKVRAYTDVADGSELPIDDSGDVVVECDQSSTKAGVTLVPSGVPVPDGSCSLRLLRHGTRAVVRFHASICMVRPGALRSALQEAATITEGVVNSRVVITDGVDEAGRGVSVMVAVADLDVGLLDEIRFAHWVWAVASLAGWARDDLAEEFM